MIKQVKDVVENINLIQVRFVELCCWKKFPFLRFKAKKLVESVPQVLCENLSKSDAEIIKAKLEAIGGVCVVEWDEKQKQIFGLNRYKFSFFVVLLYKKKKETGKRVSTWS